MGELARDGVTARPYLADVRNGRQLEGALAQAATEPRPRRRAAVQPATVAGLPEAGTRHRPSARARGLAILRAGPHARRPRGAAGHAGGPRRLDHPHQRRHFGEVPRRVRRHIHRISRGDRVRRDAARGTERGRHPGASTGHPRRHPQAPLARGLDDVADRIWALHSEPGQFRDMLIPLDDGRE
ncbi:hypothetical protein [Demequina litorisediminis]|uniref:hypothetical protein n=1 Tax=Demequina litorisediminis TaxID=1849022 RepID=UPI0024E13032|nr:hypothetical protein [Demequina litorisediminis]